MSAEKRADADALAVVRRAFEGLAGMDRRVPDEDARVKSAFGGVMSPDVEFSFLGPGWEAGEAADDVAGLPGFGRGPREMQVAWEGWAESFDSYRQWPAEYHSKGDRVMVRLRTEATLASGSVPIEAEQGALVTVRDGLIISLQFFYAADDALRALQQE